jgi:Raf kinase inhibitor-like YbhB/YbcL family protein
VRYVVCATIAALSLLSLPVAAAAQPDTGAGLTLSTGAFMPDGPWSWRYTCYNALEPSPPVSWSGVPAATVSLALLLDAPDKPAGIDIHWLIFNMSPDMAGLAEGVPKIESLPNGAAQARNDFGKLGYGAPCPPVLTTFTYRFTLFAMDETLDLPPGTDARAVAPALQDHVLASAEISGSYLRPAWPWG